MDFAKVIELIQNEHCRNCKAGKALIALKGLDERKAEERPTPSQPVTSGNGQRKPAIKISQLPKGKGKACKKCGQSKPLDAFPKHTQCADGHTGTCRQCINNRVRERAAKKRKESAKVEETAPESEAPAARSPKQPDGNAAKPFGCDKCGVRFILKTSLAEHMRMRHAAA